jgi:hypothetical protein
MRLLENTRIQCIILLAVTGLFAGVNWLRIESFWGDPARSLFEIYRASNGEMPYRDFTFPYPPLTISVLGLILHYGGSSFRVAQIAYDAVSLGCVFAVWVLARRFARPVPAFFVTLAFAIASANTKSFALFSLGIYTPSILFGLAGTALASAGLVDLIRTGISRATAAYWAGGGFLWFMCIPDAAAGLLAALICMAFIAMRAFGTRTDRIGELNRVLRASALLLSPSIATYAVLALFLGIGPIVTGVSAYGEASSVCPWWPNGFSAVKGVAAICAAVAGVAIAEILIAKPKAASEGSARSAPWLWAIGGASVWLLHSSVFFGQLAAADGQSYRSGALGIANYLASSVTFATPLMWAWWLMFALELVDWLRSRGDWNTDAKLSLVMLGLLCGASLRGLFGAPGTSSSRPPEAIQGLIFPFLPFLLSRMFHHWAKLRRVAFYPPGATRIQILACVVLCLVAVVRIASMCVKRDYKPYIAINTDAGPVRVADRDSADLYAFMKANTLPDEPFADLAYGGAVNFALHRSTPLYSTQFDGFLPTAQHRARDASQLLAAKTRFVIKPNLRPARYGTGAGCSFPRFAWKAPPCPGCDGIVFPVIQAIDEQYSSVAHFGDRDVYSRAAALNSASSMPARGVLSPSTTNRY